MQLRSLIIIILLELLPHHSSDAMIASPGFGAARPAHRLIPVIATRKVATIVRSIAGIPSRRRAEARMAKVIMSLGTKWKFIGDGT